MLTFWEILDRAINTGPVMDSKDYDKKIFKTAKRLSKDYDFRYDPETPIPSDNTLADDLFEAGLELFLETGSYCVDSQRVIKYSEEEIKEALREVSSEITIGQKQEQRKLSQREIEDKKEPLVLGGVIESNPNEGEIFTKLYQTVAREKEVDGIYWGPCQTIEGYKWRPNTPLELHAGICCSSWVREALRRVGRPGLPLISGCPSALADISSFKQEHGMRRTDAIAVPTVSELKTNYDSLAKVAFSLNEGCIRNPYWTPMIGGYAGGPEGAAIVGVAGGLHALLTCYTKYSGFNLGTAIVSEPRSITTARKAIWSTSTLGQALVRNTKMILGMGVTTASGPGTEMMFLENGATAIANSVSGGHILHGIRKAVLTKPNQAGGLEPKFQGEVAKGAAGLRREEASEMVKSLLSKYEDKFKSAPEGKSFDELYDLSTLVPKEDYQDTYQKARTKISEMGLFK